MTSYKPKIYRSVEGCCICKAKSSSSRFTDSDKYENEFEHCFQLESERAGDICNACVLIVKRWRQLPRGTAKNWAHVVDARAGPGHNTKKMMVSVVLKPNNKKRPFEDDDEKSSKIVRKKKKVVKRKLELEPRVEEKFEKIRRKNKSNVRRRLSTEQRQMNTAVSGFVDLGYWRRMDSCCGLVYVGQLGEVMLDQTRHSPCPAHTRKTSSMTSSVETSKTPDIFLAPLSPGGIDSDKSFIDEDDDDADSVSFYSDTDSSISKVSKTDLAQHTDDEGFEGFYDKTFNKRIQESIALI